MPCLRILSTTEGFISYVLCCWLLGLLIGVSTPLMAATAKGSTHIPVVTEQEIIEAVANRNPFANTLYDASIKRWAKVYTPQHPWYWNKAQLIAESALNPNAISSAGAMGLGQFMPKTWEQMQRELGFYGSPMVPAFSIQSHAYYMSTLIGQFKKDRPYKDKYSLALAAYNAGLGNILKAQKKTGGSLLYAPMASKLPLVTGHHANETTTYVNRIWQYIAILEKLEGTQDE